MYLKRSIRGFFCKAMLMGLIFSAGLNAYSAVWTDVNQWSPAWEDQYADWVKNNWQVDFFSRSKLPHGQKNPYAGLRLDCADTVYSMRIIFAFENKLPFIIQDPTSSGRTLSNKMSRWDGQNEITRIRQFLLFMFQTVSTRSLPNDTYPTVISRDHIRSGSLLLTVAKNHHSWSIKEILPIGVPHLVYNSTVGATSGPELQQRQSWPNPQWVFEGNFSPSGNGGFRTWRPAAYLNKPVWTVPGYSEEQYKIPMGKWVKILQQKLALRLETDSQMMTRMLNTTCENLRGRVNAVNDGLNFLKSHSGCMDFEDYDTYSTPNRDQRSFDDFAALRTAYREILASNSGNQLPDEIKESLNTIFPFIHESAVQESHKMTPLNSSAHQKFCSTQYLPGKQMDVAEFKRRLFAGMISNNPNDEGAYRWGDQRGPSRRAKSCPSWDIWVPDLRKI